MDKPAIKKFAIWARNKLIADTKYRAGLVGVTETAVAEPLPQSNETVQFFDVGLPQPYRIEGEAVTQRQRFVAELNKETAKQGSYTAAYQTVVDKVAYTWFNRLIAVRYMEVNDLLPSRTRVLSSADGRAEPQIVTTPFDAVLDYTPAEQQQIVTLKNDNSWTRRSACCSSSSVPRWATACPACLSRWTTICRCCWRSPSPIRTAWSAIW